MDLKKIIDKKDEAAQYMIDEITHIIKTFEKRDPGSKGEHQAAEYMADTLKDLGCQHVEVESFKENPGSFFGWIYFTITFVLAAIVLYFLSFKASFLAFASIALIVAGLVIVLLEFGVYKKCVDKFFPEKTGHNVTAIKECTGETKQRLIFCGHIDAAWEWPVNYALGGVGFEAHAILGFGGAFYFLVMSVLRAFDIVEATTLTKLGLWGLIFVPFLIGLYWMWIESRIVDGANDNLSGCYMGIALIKALKDEGIDLEHTEIGCILAGSEEAGLRGSKAWCEAHKGEFQDVPTVIISYDTIHDPKYLMVNYRELNGTVKMDKKHSDMFLNAAKSIDVPIIKGWVPPLGGATDGAAFTQAGFTSVSITGLNHKLENYYHTRRDTYDNMNAEGLANCFAATAKMLEVFDKGE